jgi:hypothetical protein
MSAVWDLISICFLSTACLVLALVHGADYFAFFSRTYRSHRTGRSYSEISDIAEVAKRGRAVLKANARRFAANACPIIEEIMRAGATSHNAGVGMPMGRDARMI